MVEGGGGGRGGEHMAHQNMDIKTLRLRGGCDADEPFDQQSRSKYFVSDKTHSPPDKLGRFCI